MSALIGNVTLDKRATQRWLTNTTGTKRGGDDSGSA